MCPVEVDAERATRDYSSGALIRAERLSPMRGQRMAERLHAADGQADRRLSAVAVGDSCGLAE